MKIKTIAMYLPQFHRVPENDEWWGEGFTEWTTVKAARQLRDGHNQPKEPLDDNYYNLLDKATMQWQAELAHKYGVYGFSFYHYWFKDGRRILEKPAENLLKWKDINMNFCFTWANETWARSWSNINVKNSWSEKYEDRRLDELTEKGVLLDQKYQGEDQWKEHFYYMLPFFKDKRYIKKDGHPIFIIYRPEIIPCLNKMIECWNTLATQNGIRRLYVIGAADMEEADFTSLDATMIREPITSMRLLNRRGEGFEHHDGMMLYQNDALIKCNVNRTLKRNQYNSVFVNYDDTPRRGTKGTLIDGVTPAKFYKTMKENLIKCNIEGKEFLFINAWNEWGEGMYLEPDKVHQYQFLESHKKAMDESRKFLTKITSFRSIIKRKKCTRQYRGDAGNNNLELIKYKSYFRILNQWMILKENNISLARILARKGYQKVAIYGMGFMGKHLYEELKNSEITIDYAIDKNAMMMRHSLLILELKDDFPPVDAIIVTATFDYDNIALFLKKKTSSPIISLEEIIAEAY